MWKCLHVKYPLFLSDFNQTWIFVTDFEKKSLNMKFNQIPFSGSRVVQCDRTDMKLNSRFSQFCERDQKQLFGRSRLIWQVNCNVRFVCVCVCVCVSNHSQPARDLRKCATVFDQTCPCVHLFRWKTFWEFVVNCDLVNNNNSAFMKMGKGVVNVLYQLSVKYYMVKVISCWI